MEASKTPFVLTVFVCTNLRPDGRTCCSQRGSDRIRDLLKDWVKRHGLDDRVRVSKSGCLDRCSEGPNVMIFPDGIWYRGVTEADVPAIIERHFLPLESTRTG
jgi:(2Fe-2S) ferredoxin